MTKRIIRCAFVSIIGATVFYTLDRIIGDPTSFCRDFAAMAYATIAMGFFTHA